MKYKLVVIITLMLFLMPLVATYGQISYKINREKVILDIQSSGVVLLRYNLTLTVESGTISKFVRIGMPNKDFEVYLAQEVFPDGRTIDAEFVEVREGDYFAVELRPSSPIVAGSSRTYIVEAEVKNFVFEDKTNSGNAGLRFIPSWFSAQIDILEVFVVLPKGVSPSEVKNQPDYDNVGHTDDGRLYLYWVRKDLPPDYKLDIGVSFPQKYVENVVSSPEEGGFLDTIFGAAFIGIIGLILIIALLFSVVSFVRFVKSWMEKLPYMSPEILVESLGPNKKLEPVEVAYLKKLEGKKLSYGRIFAIMISTLSRKGALRVESLDPLILERTDIPKHTLLRVYEKRFLECIEKRGLDEDCLVKVIKLLHKRVEKEMAGYSRKETLRHYDGIVRGLWRRIREASPEEKEVLIRDNLDWLLIDEKFEHHLKEALEGGITQTVVGIPQRDVWIWWPIGTRIPPGRYEPVPTETPKTEVPVPRSSGDVPIITNIEKAADSIVRSVEKVSSGVVKSIEEFSDKVARAIIPVRPRRAVGGRRRTSHISCACVSCACACACVSCACACAGGGVG